MFVQFVFVVCRVRLRCVCCYCGVFRVIVVGRGVVLVWCRFNCLYVCLFVFVCVCLLLLGLL